jgi:hypothetical protein
MAPSPRHLGCFGSNRPDFPLVLAAMGFAHFAPLNVLSKENCPGSRGGWRWGDLQTRVGAVPLGNGGGFQDDASCLRCSSRVVHAGAGFNSNAGHRRGALETGSLRAN